MKITRDKAYKQVLRNILAAPIHGMNPDQRSRLELLAIQKVPLECGDYTQFTYIEWEWAFGVGASIRMPHAVPVAKNMELKVSWSSSGGDLTRAMAACSLYRQVVELACHLQTYLQDCKFTEEEG